MECVSVLGFSNNTRCAATTTSWKTQGQGTVLKDHQAQRIQSEHKWFLLCTSLFPLISQCFMLCQSIAEGPVPSMGPHTSHQNTPSYMVSPRNTLDIKAITDGRGLCSCSHVLLIKYVQALWTRSRCKCIFDITQHDNFFGVTEMQSIQINLSAETISLFLRICTLHLLQPRALPVPWS